MILAPGTVHVWYLETERLRLPTTLHDCRLLLSPAELERWQRFGTWRGRREYLLTRDLVRTTLSRYADVDPRAWRFRVGPSGRPEIDPIDAAPGEPPLRFNVSHTAGLVVCAVARERAVGVDVERWDRPHRAEALADRYFAPDEAAAVRAAPPHARNSLFVRLWTVKEAYVKARAATLATALRDAAFAVDPDGTVRARFADRTGDDPAGWQFVLLAPTRKHCAALAVRTEPSEAPLAIAIKNARIDGPDGHADPDRR
jgi:4'-phosphopantetheinyl transferase